ncbi:MAG: DinB family protein [Planctomycetes bacterium]|nr:DinB family protein [Planctomycetota bacterium]
MPLRPSADEFSPHHQAYIDRVPLGDVLVHLHTQGRSTLRLLHALSESRAGYRYAEGKWTVKQVVQHVIDGERLFGYRALCFARGEAGALPGFDENLYAANDGSAGRTVASLGAEYAAVRAATCALYEGFDGPAWGRRGIANGKPITVRALPWVTAGHELHHLAVLHERYGIG